MRLKSSISNQNKAVVQGVDVYPVRDPSRSRDADAGLIEGAPTRVPPTRLDISELKNGDGKYQLDFAEVNKVT